MKFISEAVQEKIVEDLVEAVLGGQLDRQDISDTIKAFAEAEDIGVHSNKDITNEVEVVLDVLSSLEDGLSIDEACEKFELSEKLVKQVSIANKKAGGSLITKRKDRKTRARKATQTTGLSKSKRQKTARKAAKTRKRMKGTSADRKAKKLRKKSMKKRQQMGL
ncbi:hypothetical protein [Vibrio phage XZ1]|uniref:Capsid and scaffold protein n=3 Tax=Schizotequatrovirus TaxID=1198137 RepID=A0A126HGW1_9CAUD|nr:head scaffolding protein [Vibrio phage VH7D]YP_009201387.1 head scaffolding protein [Vibrio phage ValKK3]ALP47109.1 capsid and scaffold protein [Vibrio phage phi-Grn1]ALP47491.1 capsid and scaffold protein [Vibrio phage phi-ST2]QBX06113.1 prohead core protein protease [Vibrio phage Va3]QNJ54738.1 prohead core protein protease [Vibrio phage vB_ValM_R10Z]QNJ55125.1 prohead core protein protease [Vibrio phage vB_ValM_R11Z]UOL51173.1 hypothetical protein [Vibrio phage XZ1]URQ03561.1 prohead 